MKNSIYCLLALALFFAACEKDAQHITPIVDFEDPATIPATVLVRVIDPKGNPVADADVRLNGKGHNTDDLGILYLKSTEIPIQSYITVYKYGYFHGSRRFTAKQGQTHYVTIMLLPLEVIGVVAAGTGGKLSNQQGVTLDFPPNAIIDADSSMYNGVVRVACQFIPADDPDLSIRMPGDLIGIDSDNETMGLGSFGMVAVELRSPSGEILHVNEESEVEMRIPVPEQMVAKAPAIIPMWYFDEDRGLWIEEGESSLQGNEYVSRVQHFSFWNWDVPDRLVEWEASFRYSAGDGIPAADVKVCVTAANGTTRCAITNATGLVSGWVPADMSLFMEVIAGCGDVLYSDNIGPYASDAVEQPVSIPMGIESFTSLSGNVIDCEGDPVRNGYVLAWSNKVSTSTEVNSDGSFAFDFIHCGGDVVLTVVDALENKRSHPIVVGHSEVIDVGKIAACDALSKFIEFEVEGFETPMLFTGFSTNTSANRLYLAQYLDELVFELTTPLEVGVYDEVSYILNIKLPNGIIAVASELSVTLSYVGGSGSLVLGAMTGKLISNEGSSGNLEYDFKGSFSLVRS